MVEVRNFPGFIDQEEGAMRSKYREREESEKQSSSVLISNELSSLPPKGTLEFGK